MKIKILTADNYRKMTWKNGLGFTTEMVIEPADSTVLANNFHWRLSSAELNQDGPFSLFPGYTRIITIKDGGPLKLSFKSETHQLIPGKVFSFSGEDSVYCELESTKTTDLNLIYNSTNTRCKLDVLTTANDTLLTEGVYLFFVSSGSLQLVATNLYTLDVGQSETAVIQVSKGESIVVSSKPNPGTTYCFIQIFKF